MSATDGALERLRRRAARGRGDRAATSQSRDEPRRSGRWPRPARGRPRRRTSTRSCSRRSARATCSTTASRGCSTAPTPTCALLAGDYLYALGLERLAARRRPRGGPRAGRPDQPLGAAPRRRRATAGRLADALWLASAVAVGAGADDEHERAKDALRAGDADAADALLEPPRESARSGPGCGDALADAADSIGFASRTPRPWLTHGNRQAGGAQERLEKPDPAGYFEGESMTRRTAFAVAGQALGGSPGAIVALPAIGFAAGAAVRGGGRHLAGRRPARRLHRRHLPPVVITDRSTGSARPARPPPTSARARPERGRLDEEPDELRRDLDPLRPPRLPGPLRRRPPATSSAPATAASTTSRAR